MRKLTITATFCGFICCLLQVKLDEAQVAEQNALRKQLQQEQDLLQRFQESKEEKLKVQHGREKAAMDTKVEARKKELEKQVCALWCVFNG